VQNENLNMNLKTINCCVMLIYVDEYVPEVNNADFNPKISVSRR